MIEDIDWNAKFQEAAATPLFDAFSAKLSAFARGEGPAPTAEEHEAARAEGQAAKARVDAFSVEFGKVLA